MAHITQQKKPVLRGNGLNKQVHDQLWPSLEGTRQSASLGILTSGSTYSPPPSRSHIRSGTVAIVAAFVPSHSGGAVLDLHQLPLSSSTELELHDTVAQRWCQSAPM